MKSSGTAPPRTSLRPRRPWLVPRLRPRTRAEGFGFPWPESRLGGRVGLKHADAEVRRSLPLSIPSLPPIPGKGRWSTRTRASVPDVHGKPSRGTDRPRCRDTVGQWLRSCSATPVEGPAKCAPGSLGPPFPGSPSLVPYRALHLSNSLTPPPRLMVRSDPAGSPYRLQGSGMFHFPSLQSFINRTPSGAPRN